MSNEKSKPIGFLRNKTSKKGMDFLTGSIELNGEKVALVVFKNTKKFSEDSPDYSIFVSQPLAGAQGGTSAQSTQKQAPLREVPSFEDEGLF